MKKYQIYYIIDHILNFYMIKNAKTKIEKDKYIEQVKKNLIRIFEEQNSINDIYKTRLIV